MRNDGGNTHQIMKSDADRKARKIERRTYPEAPQTIKEQKTDNRGGIPVKRATAVWKADIGYLEAEPGSFFLVVATTHRDPINADLYVKENDTSYLDGSVRIPWKFSNNLISVYELEF